MGVNSLSIFIVFSTDQDKKIYIFPAGQVNEDVHLKKKTVQLDYLLITAAVG